MLEINPLHIPSHLKQRDGLVHLLGVEVTPLGDHRDWHVPFSQRRHLAGAAVWRRRENSARDVKHPRRIGLYLPAVVRRR